jgi:hypothetical protein
MVTIVQQALADEGSERMQVVADYWINQGIEQGIEQGVCRTCKKAFWIC